MYVFVLQGRRCETIYMVQKLDAERIEKARHKSESTNNRREEEKQRIKETIAQNRRGERKGRVIMPERKEYAFQEAPKVRVAVYCRVSTAEEAQVGSFEMQVQHFQQDMMQINVCNSYSLPNIVYIHYITPHKKVNRTARKSSRPCFILLFLLFSSFSSCHSPCQTTD